MWVLISSSQRAVSVRCRRRFSPRSPTKHNYEDGKVPLTLRDTRRVSLCKHLTPKVRIAGMENAARRRAKSLWRQLEIKETASPSFECDNLQPESFFLRVLVTKAKNFFALITKKEVLSTATISHTVGREG